MFLLHDLKIIFLLVFFKCNRFSLIMKIWIIAIIEICINILYIL